jgi:hypothetical protein
MQMFMIHMRKGDKSIPLLWALDTKTEDRLKKNLNHSWGTAMLYAFPERDGAERVMAEVPALFDMDDARAKTLHIVEYTSTKN